MNNIFKKTLSMAGAGLGSAGVLFVGIRLYQYSGQLDIHKFGIVSWIAIFSLSLIYSAFNFLLAISWWNILLLLHDRIHKTWAITTYGISQLAKYIPGNIFQFAGRQAMGLAVDLPGKTLAKSIFWEIAFISMAGSLYICLALPLVWTQLSIFLSLLLFFFFFTAIVLFLNRWLGSHAVRAFVSHLVFLGLSGFVFVCTLYVVGGNENLKFESILIYSAAYVVSWLIGLVTPGAPAGLGVREFMLLFLLGNEITETTLLMGLLLNRFITVAGDGWFFIWASVMVYKKNSCKLRKII